MPEPAARAGLAIEADKAATPKRKAVVEGSGITVLPEADIAMKPLQPESRV
jgi:hypothetical protein